MNLGSAVVVYVVKIHRIFGHDKLSEDYKKWQLGKLGQDFVDRGYSQGKANFAILFDDVI